MTLTPVGGGRFRDQHGRVLEEYINDKGEPDIKPVGLWGGDKDGVVFFKKEEQ